MPVLVNRQGTDLAPAVGHKRHRRGLGLRVRIGIRIGVGVGLGLRIRVRHLGLRHRERHGVRLLGPVLGRDRQGCRCNAVHELGRGRLDARNVALRSAAQGHLARRALGKLNLIAGHVRREALDGNCHAVVQRVGEGGEVGVGVLHDLLLAEHLEAVEVEGVARGGGVLEAVVLQTDRVLALLVKHHREGALVELLGCGVLVVHAHLLAVHEDVDRARAGAGLGVDGDRLAGERVLNVGTRLAVVDVGAAVPLGPGHEVVPVALLDALVLALDVLDVVVLLVGLVVAALAGAQVGVALVGHHVNGLPVVDARVDLPVENRGVAVEVLLHARLGDDARVAHPERRGAVDELCHLHSVFQRLDPIEGARERRLVNGGVAAVGARVLRLARRVGAGEHVVLEGRVGAKVVGVRL